MKRNYGTEMRWAFGVAVLVVTVLASHIGLTAIARSDSLTPSGPIVVRGESGVVISGLRITSDHGNCITIENSSDVTIENSEVGPCGSDSAKDIGNGVVIFGSDHVSVYDSYIHAEGAASACCDTHDNVLVQGSSDVAIQGNIIAFGETNIEINMAPNDHISVVGNFLLNPRGPFPRGQNVQSWGAKDLGPNTNIYVTNNYALSTKDPAAYPFTANQEDSINFGYTLGAVAQANYIVGGFSPSGCGLIADDHANGMRFLNNILVDTGQCGVGIANGKDQVVSGNKILNLTPIAGAGNTAVYVWNQYKTAPCGPVTVEHNIGDELSADGASHAGFWDGGGCDGVNTDDNNWGGLGYAQLYPMSQTNPPPAVPVMPKHCVATSPYSTNKSQAPCAGTARSPSATPQ